MKKAKQKPEVMEMREEYDFSKGVRGKYAQRYAEGTEIKREVFETMPEISRFYGIIIGMFWDEHNPPHFHVRYSDYEAAIRISDFAILEGKLPPKAFALVVEWAAIHQSELLEDWELARQMQSLKKISPLE